MVDLEVSVLGVLVSKVSTLNFKAFILLEYFVGLFVDCIEH